jgi:hypothetical protein
MLTILHKFVSRLIKIHGSEISGDSSLYAAPEFFFVENQVLFP